MVAFNKSVPLPLTQYKVTQDHKVLERTASHQGTQAHEYVALVSASYEVGEDVKQRILDHALGAQHTADKSHTGLQARKTSTVHPEEGYLNFGTIEVVRTFSTQSAADLWARHMAEALNDAAVAERSVRNPTALVHISALLDP